MSTCKPVGLRITASISTDLGQKNPRTLLCQVTGVTMDWISNYCTCTDFWNYAWKNHSL